MNRNRLVATKARSTRRRFALWSCAFFVTFASSWLPFGPGHAAAADNARDIVQEAQTAKARAHIFNVGHGLTPETNIDAISWAINAVRER